MHPITATLVKGTRMVKNHTKRRIERLRYAWAARGEQAVQTTSLDGIEIYLPPDDREIAPKIYSNKQYDPTTCTVLRKHLSRGDTAIDVGANIGQMTFVMAKAVGESGSVIAFEPDEQNRSLLKASVSMNDLENIDIRSTALGRDEGKTTLVRHKSNKGAHSTTKQAIPRTDILNATEVMIKRLDDLDLVPNLIKIDTEGGEPAIIEGGIKMIESHRPIIHIEVDPGKWDKPVRDVVNKLSEIGYMFEDVKTGDTLSLDELSDGNRRNVLAKAD